MRHKEKGSGADPWLSLIHILNVKFPLATLKMSLGIDPETGEEMFNEFNLQGTMQA